MPEPERRLWAALRGKQMGVKFRRQVSVGAYVVDFFCFESRLAIEVDGETHFSPSGSAHDTKRDRFLASQGICVVRFTNREIMENLAGCLEVLMRILEGENTPSISP